MKFLRIMAVVVGIPLLAVMISATADSFSDVAGSETIGTTTRSRKLRVVTPASIDDTGASRVNLDDYRPYDPVPSSSKASVRPGPIQHGTPLMPFIPRPSPPGHPKLADSPQSTLP